MHCRVDDKPTEIESRILGVGRLGDESLFRAKGCENCNYSGYKGRIAIMEILRMSPDLDEMVARRATVREIEQVALKQGYRKLADDGIQHVKNGNTTLDELSRVVDFTSRIG